MFNIPGVKTLLIIVIASALIALTYMELKVSNLQKEATESKNKLEACKNQKAVDSFEQIWNKRIKRKIDANKINLGIGEHNITF